MKSNIGGLDKRIRLLLALVIAFLTYFKVINDTISYILIAIAFFLVFTSLVRFCPLYGILGISTCKPKNIDK